MARTVEGNKQGDLVDYIPDVFGNREDPDPFVVSFIEPTEGDRRRLAASAQRRVDPENIEGALEFQREILCERVKAVKGYSVRGIDIVNGETLSDFGESEVVADVFGALMYGNQLTENESKN